MLSKALVMEVCFHRSPAFGEVGVLSFHRVFERRDKFLYLGEFYKEFERYVKKDLYTGSSLHWAPVGETGQVRLLGLLREKENAYLGSFLLDSEDIKC
jgi:hypothetical protein